MLDLSKIDGAAKKLAEIKRFRSTATAKGAICWVLHAGLDLFEAEAAKEQQDKALRAKIELFLATNQTFFGNSHRLRIRNGGYDIRHVSNIDLQIDAGAEVIKDDGKQVVLRLAPGEKPVTRYRKLEAA